MMTPLKTLVLGAAALSSLSLPVLAGGSTVPTVQNGAWTDPATWLTGAMPDPDFAESARVNHDVTISTAGLTCSGGITVGYGGPGSLTMTDGSMDDAGLSVGWTDRASMTLSGGTYNSTLVRVGYQGEGEMTVTGGSLLIWGLTLGFSSGTTEPGTFIVEGGEAVIDLDDRVTLGSLGTIVLRPTANGAAGLSTIETNYLQYSGGTIELDTSLYQPAVGDSWVAFTHGPAVIGTLNNLVAPPGYTVVEDQSTPGQVRFTVTGVPVWSDLGGGTATPGGQPSLAMSGPLTPASTITLDLIEAPASELAYLFISVASSPTPFLGGTLHTFPFDELIVVATDGAGEFHDSTPFLGAASGQELWFQVGVTDASDPVFGAALSNGVRGVVP